MDKVWSTRRHRLRLDTTRSARSVSVATNTITCLCKLRFHLAPNSTTWLQKLRNLSLISRSSHSQSASRSTTNRRCHRRRMFYSRTRSFLSRRSHRQPNIVVDPLNCADVTLSPSRNRSLSAARPETELTRVAQSIWNPVAIIVPAVITGATLITNWPSTPSIWLTGIKSTLMHLLLSNWSRSTRKMIYKGKSWTTKRPS